MGREKDDYVTEHYDLKAEHFICKHCEIKLTNKTSVTRLKHHLLGEKNKGVRTCAAVPVEVKALLQTADSNKRRRTLESSSANNEMPNPASTSLPPQNNLLVQEQAALQNEIHGTEQVILESSNPEPSPKQQRTRQDRSIPLLTSELVGTSYEEKKKEILSSLMKKNVFKVGIYGMGGAGKTELARHIYNKLLEQPDYDFVCWITVSPDLSIRKLQNIIANAINFELPNKDVEITRAELSRRLFDKKFVIILDDLWDYISLDDVGMTDGSLNGCKLIMTTRSLHICRAMNCQENVFVDCHQLLSLDDEQWKIFKQELGKEGRLSGEIKKVAKSIVQTSGGLPVMIKCMARSMRGVEDIAEWRDALEEMKSCEMNEEVLQQLKRSYDHLKDQSLRHCFLYCALFDGIIERRDLIEHLIVEGIIEGTGNRRAKVDRAHTLLNKLDNVCLLSCAGYFVEMHGLIRKMAFQIMKEKIPSKVEFSEEIKYLFMKDKMTISLNVPNKNLNPSDYVATCPNVSTLLMRDRCWLTSIEDSFYDRFQNLKVLDLSSSGIGQLPKSVGGLKNLKALFLGNCKKLKHIPSLAKLDSLEQLYLRGCNDLEHIPSLAESLEVLHLSSYKLEHIPSLAELESLKVLDLSGCDKLEHIPSLAKLESLEVLNLRRCDKLEHIPSLAKLVSLEVLDLHFCAVQEVPKGVKRLSNLRVLDLSGSGIKELKAGILERLSNLEILAFHGPFKLGVEIAGLSELDSLGWWFNNIDEFDSFLSKACSASLKAYTIYVGQCDPYGLQTNGAGDREMRFYRCNIERVYLFSLSSCPTLLKRVEKVELYELSNLCHLFGRETEYEVSPNTKSPQTSLFSDLKTFHISDCDSIENLFPLHLLSNLQNLQELTVRSCSAMEEIIAAPEQNLTDANSHPNSIQTPHFSLPKLNSLYLERLPKLTSICRAQINCESLYRIYIDGCEDLKKIPIFLSRPSLVVLQVPTETWWESVSWGSSEQKDILQPDFYWD